MKNLQRRAGLLILLLMLIAALLVAPLLAQDNDTINVAGSGIVAPAFQAVADASGSNAALNVSVTGANAGISALCSNTADVALTNRPMTAAEEQQCQGGSVAFVELVFGYDSTVFITSNENTYLQCLTQENLNTLLVPSAAGQINTWDQVNPEYPANPLALVVPPQNTLPFAKIDTLVNGDGLRNDAQTAADNAAVIAAVAGNPDALGIVQFNAIQSGDTGVKAVQYTNPTLNTCVTPSLDTLNDRTYPLADRLFAYVNTNSLQKPGLSDVLNFALSETGGAALTSAGYVPASAEIYTTGQETLAGSATGRVFSRDITAFTIPDSVSGAVNIAGAAQVFQYTQNLSQAITAAYPGLTLTPRLEGVPAGARRFCNGEVEVLATYGALTDEQTANCTANNITPNTFNLGRQAVVLVSNANSPYLACLTTSQIATAFASKAEDATIATWNQVADTFPEVNVLLFTPEQGSDLSDLLMVKAAGIAITVRDDAEQNGDVLYRAAAVANVEGALTYMTWDEYQQVVENNQERIQLVGVNAGADCVTPAVDTITDGTYPLTIDLNLVVGQSNLQNNVVQSLLWYIFSDANYSLIESAGLIGISFGDLPAIRDTLQSAFTQAAAVPEVVATAEAGATDEVSATEDASATDEPAATIEVIASEEAAATEDVTAEPAATEDATPEATPAA